MPNYKAFVRIQGIRLTNISQSSSSGGPSIVSMLRESNRMISYQAHAGEPSFRAELKNIRDPKFEVTASRIPYPYTGKCGKGTYKFVDRNTEQRTVNNCSELTEESELTFYAPYFPWPYNRDDYPDDTFSAGEYPYIDRPDISRTFEHTEAEHIYIANLLERFQELI